MADTEPAHEPAPPADAPDVEAGEGDAADQKSDDGDIPKPVEPTKVEKPPKRLVDPDQKNTTFNQKNAYYLVAALLAINAVGYFVSAIVWVDTKEESGTVAAMALSFSAWSCIAIAFEWDSYNKMKRPDRSVELIAFSVFHFLMACSWGWEVTTKDRDAGAAIAHAVLMMFFTLMAMLYTSSKKPASEQLVDILTAKPKNSMQLALVALLAVNALILLLAGIFAYSSSGWNAEDIDDKKAGAGYFAWMCYCGFVLIFPENNRDHALISVFAVHAMEVAVAVFKNGDGGGDGFEGRIYLHFLFSIVFGCVILFNLKADQASPAEKRFEAREHHEARIKAHKQYEAEHAEYMKELAAYEKAVKAKLKAEGEDGEAGDADADADADADGGDDAAAADDAAGDNTTGDDAAAAGGAGDGGDGEAGADDDAPVDPEKDKQENYKTDNVDEV